MRKRWQFSLLNDEQRVATRWGVVRNNQIMQCHKGFERCSSGMSGYCFGETSGPLLSFTQKWKKLTKFDELIPHMMDFEMVSPASNMASCWISMLNFRV